MECPHCGHSGNGVIKRLEYVGGQGNILVTQCANRRNCWRRWDKKYL